MIQLIGAVLLIFGTVEWMVFGSQLIPAQNARAVAVAECVSVPIDTTRIVWARADSIVSSDGRYADGLHASLLGLHLLFVVDPTDSTVVQHELLHAAGFNHNDYGQWNDSIARECVR